MTTSVFALNAVLALCVISMIALLIIDEIKHIKLRFAYNAGFRAGATCFPVYPPSPYANIALTREWFRGVRAGNHSRAIHFYTDMGDLNGSGN